MTIQEIVDHLKDDFTGLATEFAYVNLVAKVPFLSLPIVSTVTKYLISLVMQSVSNFIEQQGYYAAMSIRTTGQAIEYKNAARLYVAELKLGDPNAIAQALNARRLAFKRLAQWAG